MSTQYRSKPLAAVHEVAQDLLEASEISKQTMREFDEMCLTKVADMSAKEIRDLRLRQNASQAVFALHLNVTTGLISQWERGEKRAAPH